MHQFSRADIPRRLLIRTLRQTLDTLVDAEVALSTIYEQEREHEEEKILATESLGDAHLPTEVAGLPGKRVHRLAAAVNLGYTHPVFGQRALLYVYAVRDKPFYDGMFEHYQGLLAQFLTSNALRTENEPQLSLLIARPSEVPVRAKKYPFHADWDPGTNVELLLLKPTPEAIAAVQKRAAHLVLEDAYAQARIQPDPLIRPFCFGGTFVIPDVTMQAEARLNRVSLERAGALLEWTGLFTMRNAELSYRNLALAPRALERPYERVLRSLVQIRNGLA